MHSENSPRMIICVLFVSFPLLRLSCFCFVNALTDFTRFLSFFMCAISLVINVAHAKKCDGNVAGGVIFLVESNVRPARLEAVIYVTQHGICFSPTNVPTKLK